MATPRWKKELQERYDSGKGYQFNKKEDWRGELLKDLPQKQYGKSYDDKLTNWVKERGGDERTANAFRTWMNQQSTGEADKNKRDQERREENKRFAERQRVLRGTEEERTRIAEQREAEKPSFGRDMKETFKAAGRIVNPFDDVKASDALDDLVKYMTTHEATGWNKELNRAGARLADGATLGALGEVGKRVRGERSPYLESREGGGKVADIGYDIAGAMVNPIGGLFMKAPKTIKGLAAQGAAIGAAEGGARIAMREAINGDDYTMGENLRDFGIEVGASVGGNVVLGSIINKFRRGASVQQIAQEANLSPQQVQAAVREVETKAPEILLLEAPKPQPEPEFSSLDFGQTPKVDADLDSLFPPRVEPEVDEMDDFLSWMSRSDSPQAPQRQVSEAERWHNELEEFQRFLADNGYNSNNLSEESINELWSHFARYEDSIPLEQAVDLAYSGENAYQGLVRNRNQYPEPITQPREPNLTESLRADPRINQLANQLFGQPNVPRNPLDDIVGQPNVDELDEILSFLDQSQRNDQPLEFRREVLKRVNNQPSTKVEDNSLSEPLVSEGQTVDDGVRLQDPFGAVAGTNDTYVNSPIAKTQSTVADQVKSGQRNLKDDVLRNKQAWTSDLAVVKAIENVVKDLDVGNVLQRAKDGSVSVKDSLYKKLREAKRATGYAIRDIEKTYAPIISNLQKQGISQQDFDEYLLAKHALDIEADNARLVPLRQAAENRIAQIETDIQSGQVLPDKVDELEKEKANLMESLEFGELAPYQLPEFATPEWIQNRLARFQNNQGIQDAQTQWVQQQQRDLDMLVDAGLYTREEADRMIQAHPNYIPMVRDRGTEIFGTGNLVKPKQQVLARSKGSKDAIRSPIESAFKNRMVTYSNIKKNEALQKIEKLAKVDGQELFKEVNPFSSNISKLNTVTFFKDGKKVIYEVPESFKHMMDNLSTQADEDTISNVVQGVNRLIKKGSTHYNLEFIFRSLVRDPQTGIMTSRSGVKPHDYVAGFFDAMLGDKSPFKSYKEDFLDNGGKMAGLIGVDNQSINRLVRETMEGKFKKGIKAFPRLIEKFGEVAEMTPRLAEYRSAKKKGFTDEDAMFEAIDVMDYSDLGTKAREWNQRIPYFGAAIRGNARLLEAAKEQPAKVLGRGLMYVSLPTLGVWAAQQNASDSQKDKLKNLKTFEKNIYWHIPAPNGEDLYVIPKAHVVAQVFANPLERSLERMFNNPDSAVGEDVKQSVLDLGKSLIPPTGIAGYQQLLEAGINYNIFMDMNIESGKTEQTKTLKDGTEKLKNMADVPREQRYNMFTSEVAKKAGDVTGLSPARIDHVLRGVSGSVGNDILNGADMALDSLGLVDRPSRPEGIGNLLNPLDTFVRPNERGSGRVDRLYDTQQKNKETNTKDKTLDDLIKEIQEVSYEIATVREDKKLSPNEKKLKLAELRKQERSLANSYFE